jgi:hypothetical protein
MRVNHHNEEEVELPVPESLGQLSWRVAQRCNGGQCVRIAAHGDDIVIGHTEDHDAAISYTRAEWLAFVEGIKQGEFDDLL